MIWQNPWALAGLAAIALPVLIHLLGRGRARVHRFPTLRFLDASRLLPSRRTKLQDFVLLALRVGILAVAAAALAQPLLMTAGRAQAFGNPLARAIIVDTSASMQRVALSSEIQSGDHRASGEPAEAVARRIASHLADSARTSVILETADPASVVPGAAAWLLTQPARGEIDIVSDFQRGTFDLRDLRAVPTRLGIRLARIAVLADTSVEILSESSGFKRVAVAMPLADRTVVQWTSRRAVTVADSTPVARDAHIELLADARAQPALTAARRAASTIDVRLPVDTGRAIAIVYPSYDARTDALRDAAMPTAAWMTSAIASLRADSLLISAAADAVPLATLAGASSGAGLIVARSAAGDPIATAVQTSHDGHDRLVLVSSVDPGTLASAALIAAARRVQSAAPPLSELTPETLSDSLIVSWQRAPASSRPSSVPGREGPSDGRWLWIVVLALIAAESWWRIRERPHVA